MDVDEIKANLIMMRKYIIFHQIGIGECCAWNRLKEAFGVGQTTDEDDWAWLANYEQNKIITAEEKAWHVREEADQAARSSLHFTHGHLHQ